MRKNEHKKNFSHLKKMGKNERNMKKNLIDFQRRQEMREKWERKYLTTAGVGSMKIS